MTTSEQAAHDVADGGVEQGRRQVMEIRDRLRMVAAQDPDLAQHLVDQLIAALDNATGGTFREHLSGAAGGAAQDGSAPVVSPPRQGPSLPRNS